MLKRESGEQDDEGQILPYHGLTVAARYANREYREHLFPQSQSEQPTPWSSAGGVVLDAPPMTTTNTSPRTSVEQRLVASLTHSIWWVSWDENMDSL